MRGPRQAAASAGQALGLFARELRLVLTVFFVLFITSETWQIFGRLTGARYALLLSLLVGGAAVLGALTARQLWSDAVGERSVPRSALPGLAQRLVARVWFEILVAGFAVFAGFLILGALVVDAQLMREWTAVGDEPAAGVTELAGSGLVVSEPLVRLVGVLGGLAALLFAVELLVDRDVRTEMTDDLVREWESARA